MDNSYWWSWYGMWTWMGPITKATVVLMALMLLCAIYSFLEHVETEHAARIAADSVLEIVNRRAPLKEVISAIQTLGDRLSSPVVLAGLEAFKTAPSGVSDALAIRLAERAMERQEGLAHVEARRRLILLDTVANLAPMLGMFATMRGILSFGGSAMEKHTYFVYITNSINHAIVPAAIGLAVAVPTALFYSYVSREIEKLDARNGEFVLAVVAYLRTQPRDLSESVLSTEVQAGNMPHSGSRLVLCAVWLWWLYFVFVLCEGLYSHFAQ